MTAVPPNGPDPTTVVPTTGRIAQPAGSAPVALVPQFVGQRVEAAADTARLAGWTLVPEFVEPTMAEQPEGLVVAQKPAAGHAVTAGSVLAVSVVRRRAWMDKNGRSLFLGLAVVFAVLAVAFAVLWSSAGSSSTADIDTLQAENAALKAENATLKDQVAAAAGADGELVKTLQKQVTDLTAKLTAAEAAAAKAQADLAKAQADLTKAQADLAKSQADLAKAQSDLDAALKEVATLRAQIGGIQQSVTPMPSYVGQQQVAVEDFAKAKKLQLVIEKVTTSSSPAAVGTVLAQQPKAGIPLVEGSAIWIQVYAPK